MNWLKTELPKFKIREALSSPPQRYWNKFLFLLFFILLLVLLFDGWIFWVFLLERPEDIFLGEAAVENLDKDAMREVFESMDKKTADLERFRKEGGVEDPS